MAKGLFLRTKETGQLDALDNVPATHPYRNPAVGDIGLAFGGDTGRELLIADVDGESGDFVTWNVGGNSTNKGNFPEDYIVEFKGFSTDFPSGWVEDSQGKTSISFLGNILPDAPSGNLCAVYDTVSGNIFGFGYNIAFSLNLNTYTYAYETERDISSVQCDGAAFASDGTDLVLFGIGWTVSNVVDHFNFTSKTWASGIVMPGAVRFGSACYSPTNSRFYFFGGYDTASRDYLWEYNKGVGWTDLTLTAPLPSVMYSGMSIEAGATIYVLNGSDSNLYSIDPTNIAGGWTTLAPIPYLSASGETGGLMFESALNALFVVEDYIYLYDITLDTWVNWGYLIRNWNTHNNIVDIGSNVFFKMGCGTDGYSECEMIDMIPTYNLKRG